jgi:5'(3')-deoxyribonucleotidase
MDEEKLIILVQGHECLYNLQHKDYDEKFVKDNSWKEIG